MQLLKLLVFPLYIGPSISQVGTASRMKNDQPRVVSITEPPLVVDALVTSASANLPVQAAKDSTIRKNNYGNGNRRLDRKEYYHGQFNHGIYKSIKIERRSCRYKLIDTWVLIQTFIYQQTRHPRISEMFYANTQLISNDNFPLTLIHIPEWEREYHTAMFGVDQGNRIVYAVYQEGAKITNK